MKKSRKKFKAKTERKFGDNVNSSRRHSKRRTKAKRRDKSME